MNIEEIQVKPSKSEWKLSVKARNGGFRLAKKTKVDEDDLSEIFDSVKNRCSHCETDFVDTDDVMAELEDRYGSIIPELHGDIYSIVSDAISTKGLDMQDFDNPYLCGPCAYALSKD